MKSLLFERMGIDKDEAVTEIFVQRSVCCGHVRARWWASASVSRFRGASISVLLCDAPAVQYHLSTRIASSRV